MSASTIDATTLREELRMAREYTPEQIEVMTGEFVAAARCLGVEDRIGDPAVTVRSLLTASARWSDAATRAMGPFGAFLAGVAAAGSSTDPAVAEAIAAVDVVLTGPAAV